MMFIGSTCLPEQDKILKNGWKIIEIQQNDIMRGKNQTKRPTHPTNKKKMGFEIWKVQNMILLEMLGNYDSIFFRR